MTISVDGTEMLNSNAGRNSIPTSAWQANLPTVDAGRFTISIGNQIGFFPEDIAFKLFVPSPYTKTLSGIVTEESTPCARLLRLYRRSDGHYVASTTSNATTGAYSFTGLVAGEKYFIVAFDDLTLSPDFNALILDLMEPV